MAPAAAPVGAAADEDDESDEAAFVGEPFCCSALSLTACFWRWTTGTGAGFGVVSGLFRPPLPTEGGMISWGEKREGWRIGCVMEQSQKITYAAASWAKAKSGRSNRRRYSGFGKRILEVIANVGLLRSKS
jgi:hypothetical protein